MLLYKLLSTTLNHDPDNCSISNKQQEEAEDLITLFDCLDDLEDPLEAVAHALKMLRKTDGTIMIVEPFIIDNLEDNSNR